MDTLTAVRRIWQECFDDPEEYVDMFFADIFDPADAMVATCRDEVVSSLLLQPYTMQFHGMELPVSYLCGAATLPAYREHGLMSGLIHQALGRCADRGDAICCLIPASGYLYRYYRRFGFSEAFYAVEQRYTGAHRFRHEGVYTRLDDTDTDAVYAFFDAATRSRQCSVRHNRLRMRQAIAECAACGGTVIALADSGGSVCAMAFAAPDTADGSVRVADLLAATPDAAEAALECVARTWPRSQIKVIADPSDASTPRGGVSIRRGMARITDAASVLAAIAGANPGLKARIRVSDPLIDRNSRTFHIGKGEIRTYGHDDHAANTRLDLDVDIRVLTAIVFGNKVTADILNFPSHQPFMSLMFD